MDKILVHICCGVDAVWALRKIKEEFENSEIKGFFYDPNIHPEEEYELRWIETKRVCDSLGIECIKGEYDVENWLERVKGYENEPERGERCTICHDIRLEKSAKLAKKLGFNKFTTVLMMSPKKDFQVLKNVGEEIASRYGLEFFAIEFRKGGGIEKMNKLSKEQQLYHQNYCGCIYGLFKQREGLDIIPELVSFGKGRLPGSREELLFVKQIRAYAESKGIACSEQTFEFINWRVVSSALKVGKEHVPHTVLPYSSSVKGVLRARVDRILDRGDKRVVKLNKTNTEIWILGTGLREISLEEPRFLTNPVLIVGKEYADMFEIGKKVEIQLKTEFDYNAKSQNLIIGSLNAREKIFFYSDTLSDGTGGYRFEDIVKAIDENERDIVRGKKVIIVLGVETFGKLGRRAYKKLLEELAIEHSV